MSTIPPLWSDTVQEITPYVVRIRTPEGWGTGFFLHVDPGKPFWTIATASHVINHADDWEQPIKIEHPSSGKSMILHPHERAIFRDVRRDTAMILFQTTPIPLPAKPLQLVPARNYFRPGNELGWIGFPVIGQGELCFFNGHCSAYLKATSTYLVDGTSIHGVSGGPAFHMNPDGSPTVLGVVSAYQPNTSNGGTLPGLAMFSDVQHFHELAASFKDMADAQARAEAEEKARKTTKGDEAPPPVAVSDNG